MQRPASPSSQRGFRPEKPPSALDQIPTPSVGSRAQSPEVEEIMKAAASIHGGNTNSHHGGRTSAMRGQDANPDRQLQKAFELIQDAFERKMLDVLEENSHWKGVAQNQKTQILSLNASLTAAKKRVHDLERVLQASVAERNAILTSKNSLLDKFNALKKSASQLETFKKSVATMLNYGAPASNIHDFDKMDLTQQLPLDSQYKETTIDEEALAALGIEDMAQRLFTKSEASNLAKNTLNGTSPSGVPKTRTQPTSTQSTQRTKSSTSIASNSTPVSASRLKAAVAAGSAPSNSSPVDAPTLYRQIRDVLTTSEFETFAKTVAAFNAGRLSADDTVLHIAKLLANKRNGDLFIKMKQLINMAIQETRAASELTGH